MIAASTLQMVRPILPSANNRFDNIAPPEQVGLLIYNHTSMAERDESDDEYGASAIDSEMLYFMVINRHKVRPDRLAEIYQTMSEESLRHNPVPDTAEDQPDAIVSPCVADSDLARRIALIQL